MEREKRKRSPDERKKNPTLGDEEESKSHRNKKSKKSKESERDSRDKSKHGKRKSHHKSSHSKEKKSRDKQKVASHKHGAQAELSVDDYFSKNNEFATWLKEEKSLFFSDLSAESARDLFSDFVKRWNANKLDSRYYEGIATGPRTSHNWNIKK